MGQRGPAGERAEADEATRGSAIKLGTELLARLINIATSFLIARHYGVEAFGLFGWLSEAAVVVAEAADLGIQGLASQALVAGTLSLRSMARAKLAVSGLVILAALAAAGVAPVLSPLVVYLVLAGWSEFLGVALRARGDRLQESAVIFCLRLSLLVLLVAAIDLGAGLPALAWAHAASALPAVVLGAYLVRRRAAPGGGVAGVLPVLRRSAPLAVNGGLALLSLRVELLLMGVLVGPFATGLFLAALKVVQFLNVVPSAVCAGAMPSLTREALRGGDGVRRRTAASLAFLALPAAAGVALVAPGLVGLFGPGFVAAAPALRVLAGAVVPLFFNALLVAALIATERAAWLPRLTAVRVAVAGGLAWLLVPRLEAVGAALGFLASEVLLLLLAARACGAAGFPVRLSGPLLRAAAATLPMAVLVALAPARLPAAVALGVAAYGATLALARRWSPALLRDLFGDVRYAEGGEGKP